MKGLGCGMLAAKAPGAGVGGWPLPSAVVELANENGEDSSEAGSDIAWTDPLTGWLVGWAIVNGDPPNDATGS